MVRAVIALIEGGIKPRVAVEMPEEGFGLNGTSTYGLEIKCEFVWGD